MRRMIGLGVPTSVIAERLGLSVRTVEDYRAGLRAVMGLAPGSHGALDAALGRELGRQEGLDEARREAQAEVDRLKREVEALRAERDAAQAERDELKARERTCPTMLEAEARALMRAVQAVAAHVGLGLEASPHQVVDAVGSMAARLAEIEQQEPVALVLRSTMSRLVPWVVKDRRSLSVSASALVGSGADHLDPLYALPTTAAAPVQSEPVQGPVRLTDERIAQLAAQTWGSVDIAPQSAAAFARAIEAWMLGASKR